MAEKGIEGKEVGEVTHFFDKISVAVLSLTDTLSTGDTVRFVGHATDFSQPVESMQIEHEAVEEAGPGQEVALEVHEPVRTHDKVILIAGEDVAGS